MMSQLNLRNQIIVGLVGVISGSMLLSLPAFAETQNATMQEVNSEPTNPAAVNPSTDEQLLRNSITSPQQPWKNNDMIRYNGNGELYPNDPSLSPDSNNPGLNQSPANRLTPDLINRPF